MKTGIAIYLLIGWLVCGQFTYDAWHKCGREATLTEQVLMVTMWGPAVVYVIVTLPFHKQPETSCFSDK